jgi:hypothetical protein
MIPCQDNSFFDQSGRGFAAPSDHDMEPLVCEEAQPDSNKEKCDVNCIVNINYFSNSLLQKERFHGSKCTSGKLELVRKLKRPGLNSAFEYSCAICHRTWTVECQKQGASDYNTTAVWGSLSSGIGHTQLKDVLSTMDVRVMGPGLFSKITTQLKKVNHITYTSFW